MSGGGCAILNRSSVINNSCHYSGCELAGGRLAGGFHTRCEPSNFARINTPPAEMPISEWPNSLYCARYQEGYPSVGLFITRVGPWVVGIYIRHFYFRKLKNSRRWRSRRQPKWPAVLISTSATRARGVYTHI